MTYRASGLVLRLASKRRGVSQKQTQNEVEASLQSGNIGRQITCQPYHSVAIAPVSANRLKNENFCGIGWRLSRDSCQSCRWELGDYSNTSKFPIKFRHFAEKLTTILGLVTVGWCGRYRTSPLLVEHEGFKTTTPKVIAAVTESATYRLNEVQRVEKNPFSAPF